jgi:hypothetical protein
MAESIRTFSLKLWDEESRRLIGWRDLKTKLRRAA